MQEDYVLDYKLKCHALFWYFFFLFSFDLFYSILSAKVQPFCEQNWTLYRKWVELLKYFDLTKLILSAILTLRTNEMVTCCSFFFVFPYNYTQRGEAILFCNESTKMSKSQIFYRFCRCNVSCSKYIGFGYARLKGKWNTYFEFAFKIDENHTINWS